MAALLRHSKDLNTRFRLVLASGSPRRREILQILGIPFDVAESGFPEDLDKSNYSPAEYVVANASAKCAAVAKTLPAKEADGRQSMIIGADTVVVAPDGSILEKPGNREAACRMLAALSGRTHEVFTGIALSVAMRDADSSTSMATKTAVNRTEVAFADLTAEDIEAYVDSGEPFDKAGGYGIQAKGCLLVREIRGDYLNVVGLPLATLAELMLSVLVDPRHSMADAAGSQQCLPSSIPTYIDKLALVLVRDRRQLVARTRGKTAFFTPGGKRETGESDEQALVREISEELSVDLIRASIRPYGVFQAQAHGKPEGTLVRMTCYTADYTGKLLPSGEIEELRWVSSLERSILTVTGILLLDDLHAKNLID